MRPLNRATLTLHGPATEERLRARGGNWNYAAAFAQVYLPVGYRLFMRADCLGLRLVRRCL